MYRFMRLQGFDDYMDLYEWSIGQRAYFWDALIKFCNIRFSNPPKMTLKEGADMVSDEWFPGAANAVVLYDRATLDL